MLRRKVLWTAAALGTVGARLLGATAYEDEIAEWRKNYDRDLRSENGPLWLIGRHDVPEGKTGIGSDPSNAIVLLDRAPKRAGTIERRADKVTFAVSPGIAVTVNGKAMSGSFEVRTGARPNPNDKLKFGDFEILITGVGGQYQLTVRDKQSSYVAAFHGPVWFPVNAGYIVLAEFTPYPQPKELKVPDTGGRTRIRQAPGHVTFSLHGEALRLEPVAIEGRLFFMFKDRTSGRETYGAGRFLETELPKNGKVMLDFNKAYNPYCAFNPYSSCPLPQKYNTLITRVEAGEKYRGEH